MIIYTDENTDRSIIHVAALLGTIPESVLTPQDVLEIESNVMDLIFDKKDRDGKICVSEEFLLQ